MASRKLFSTRSVLCLKQSTRRISLSSYKCEEAVASQRDLRLSWDYAVEDAIKHVGYQSPFLKLGYMTTDKNVNWNKNIENLKNSGHPMYDTAKILLANGKANVNQMWGIVILLTSKLAGYPATNLWKEDDFDRNSGILKSQRKLAENVEFMTTGDDFHRDGVLNMQHFHKSGMNLDNDNLLIYGNKMAILAGDMLLGYASMEISKIRNYKVTALVAAFARDFAESTFIGDRDIQNNPLPSNPLEKLEVQKANPEIFEEVSSDQIDIMLPFKLHDVMGTAENEWKLRHTLGGASRLGKSCKAALILGKHDEEKQKEAYFIGKHMYLSYRAAKDLNIFRSDVLPASGKFSLISAPLLFHLEEDPSLYDEIRKGLESIDNINFAKIHEAVRNGPGMGKTRDLLSKNSLIAYTLLHKFPNSDCRRILENLMFSLES
ncbi:all trans-polyprenyl-diphosphate synthase PDSS2-like [Chironomus tepperi]|uniref:all trans-polyprenyl-diphosphate synthase PDSS2-like n=1 Tax=Chironomus tepperi TaxID=113505 RepID=UPI00391F3407